MDLVMLGRYSARFLLGGLIKCEGTLEYVNTILWANSC
jgi:hypothetical protein